MLEKKKTLAVVIIIAIVVIGFIIIKNNNKPKVTTGENAEAITVQSLEDGTKMNTSSKLTETKKVGNIEISNAQLTNKDGKTVFLADVKNTGNSKIDMLELEIILLDEKNNEIATLNGLIGTVKAGDKAQLNIATSVDYTSAYDYMIKIK